MHVPSLGTLEPLRQLSWYGILVYIKEGWRDTEINLIVLEAMSSGISKKVFEACLNFAVLSSGQLWGK